MSLTYVCLNLFQLVLDVWEDTQWKDMKAKYNWLECNGEGLGCTVCICASRAPFQRVNGQHETSWVKFKIKASGNTVSGKRKSLRDKIYKHKNSATHLDNATIVKEQQLEKLSNVAATMCAKDLEATSNVFFVAYHIAKNNLALSLYEHILTKLCKNVKVDVGSTLHSRSTCVNIINHIADESRKSIVNSIISADKKISVMLDESTTNGNVAVMVVYVRAQINGEVSNIFLDLIEVSKSADAICNSLIRTLNKHRFTDSFLKRNWLALGSDGASVMTGRKSGLGALVKQRYPNVIQWHCLNHRLELAVGDIIETLEEVQSLKSFFDALYSHFSRSSSKTKRLKSICQSHGLTFLKPKRVLSTRWAPSSFSALEVVWKNYEAFLIYFEDAEDEVFNSLYSCEFLYNLAVLLDTLEIVKYLSLTLQKQSCNVVDADRAIENAIKLLEANKTEQGSHELKVASVIKRRKYLNHDLNITKKRINKSNFLTGLIQAIEYRRVGTVGTKNSSGDRGLYDQLIQNAGIIFRDSVQDEYLPNIKLLCTTLGLDNIIEESNNFLNFASTGESSHIVGLRNVVNTIPVSNAECERGFSQMNLIITKQRSSLKIRNTSSLMFIGINGPPENSFAAQKFAKSWLLKHRSAGDKRSRLHKPKEEKPKPTWSFF